MLSLDFECDFQKIVEQLDVIVERKKMSAVIFDKII